MSVGTQIQGSPGKKFHVGMSLHCAFIMSASLPAGWNVARDYAVDALGHALTCSKLSLNTVGPELMICGSSRRWPEIDSMLNHSEDVANVLMINGSIAKSLE